MNIHDWITIASALVGAVLVIIGWHVVSQRNQKNEIAKERRSYRLDMLHSFHPIIFFIQKKKHQISAGQEAEELEKLLAEARSKFLLYGYNDEINAYENLVATFLTGNNKAKIDSLNNVADIVRQRIRSELDIPSHNLPRP